MRLSTNRTLALLIGLAFLELAFVAGTDSQGRAQAQTPEATADVDEAVAAALYDRGMALYEEGDVANAKKMFGESLGRSPSGARAADALRMLRESNEKLGIEDLDAGRPNASGDGPIDPYSEGPLDPYGQGDGTNTSGEATLDPYADPQDRTGPDGAPGPNLDVPEEGTGRVFIGHGALQGFMLGMAVIGPYERDEETGELGSVQGGAVALGLAGAGAAGYLSYYLGDKQGLTMTQGNVIASAGFWGLYNGAHLGNIFAGADSDGNDIYTGMAISGLIGTGIGYYYAKKKDPTKGQLAFTNSLTLYGTSGGLLFGVALDPPRGDAYSLNALLGSALGLGLAYYADGYRPTRRRMLKVDLGAAVGAVAPWVLIYPFTADSNSNDDEQLVGLLSVLGLAGGGYGMWLYTDGEDETDADSTGDAAISSAPPAILQRASSGAWSLATPAIRPMDMPALAPRQGVSFGTDLLSGHF